VLSTCHAVSRKRPPLEMNGRPHQSHSVLLAALRPPQPWQVVTESGRSEGVKVVEDVGAKVGAVVHRPAQSDSSDATRVANRGLRYASRVADPCTLC
jgi:hypothetical protein